MRVFYFLSVILKKIKYFLINFQKIVDNILNVAYTIITSRDRAVRKLVGLITRRSQVQILLPQPKQETKRYLFVFLFPFEPANHLASNASDLHSQPNC